MVKRAASDCLAKYGIHKVDVEFKEIWGFIYRGTEFALVRPTFGAIGMLRPTETCAENTNAVTCYREPYRRKVCQGAR